MVEVGAADWGVEQGGCIFPDLRPYLLGGGAVRIDLRVRDVGHDTTHWEGFGQIIPPGGPQADLETTLEGTGRSMCLSPAGGLDGRGKTTGSKDLRLLPPEHSHTVYCN